MTVVDVCSPRAEKISGGYETREAKLMFFNVLLRCVYTVSVVIEVRNDCPFAVWLGSFS